MLRTNHWRHGVLRRVLIPRRIWSMLHNARQPTQRVVGAYNSAPAPLRVPGQCRCQNSLAKTLVWHSQRLGRTLLLKDNALSVLSCIAERRPYPAWAVSPAKDSVPPAVCQQRIYSTVGPVREYRHPSVGRPHAVRIRLIFHTDLATASRGLLRRDRTSHKHVKAAAAMPHHRDTLTEHLCLDV